MLEQLRSSAFTAGDIGERWGSTKLVSIVKLFPGRLRFSDLLRVKKDSSSERAGSFSVLS